MSEVWVAGQVVCHNHGCFLWHTGKTLLYFLQKFTIESPSFEFAGANWSLTIQSDCMRNRWLELSLSNKVKSPIPRLFVSLGIDTAWGVSESNSGETTFFGDFSVRSWLLLSDMVKRWKEIAPDGRLIVKCKLRLHSIQAVTSPPETFPGTSANSEERFQNRFNEEVQVTEEHSAQLFKNLLSLSDSLKELFLNGEGCDVTIKVKGKKFSVHSSILRARSKVFASMMTHDMVERNSGVVSIDDCEPGAFHELLLFLYTGKVEGLSENNMLPLYCAADKYDVGDLKLECVEFMKRSLSIRAVSEVIILAKVYSEAELLKCGIDYFIKNVDQILETVEWQNFMKEYPTEANELYIKAIKTIRK